MKKIFAIAALGFLVSTGVNAQEITSKKGEVYLPKKGDWAISFDGTPIFQYLGRVFTSGNNAPNVNFFDNQRIVAKKFTSDKNAYRAIARLGFKSINQTDDSTTTDFNLQVGLGKEWRKGNTRLQGYYGADAMLMFGSGQKVKQANVDYYTKSGSSFGIGVRGFLGAEYFIVPKISIGAEYGWGLAFVSTGKSTIVNNGSEIVTNKGGSSFAADTDVNGSYSNASLRVTLHF
jgi:hypothetical protein